MFNINSLCFFSADNLELSLTLKVGYDVPPTQTFNFKLAHTEAFLVDVTFPPLNRTASHVKRTQRLQRQAMRRQRRRKPIWEGGDPITHAPTYLVCLLRLHGLPFRKLVLVNPLFTHTHASNPTLVMVQKRPTRESVIAVISKFKFLFVHFGPFPARLWRWRTTVS